MITIFTYLAGLLYFVYLATLLFMGKFEPSLSTQNLMIREKFVQTFETSPMAFSFETFVPLDPKYVYYTSILRTIENGSVVS